MLSKRIDAMRSPYDFLDEPQEQKPLSLLGSLFAHQEQIIRDTTSMVRIQGDREGENSMENLENIIYSAVVAINSLIALVALYYVAKKSVAIIRKRLRSQNNFEKFSSKGRGADLESETDYFEF